MKYFDISGILRNNRPLFIMADLHIGHNGFAEEKLKEAFEMAEDENAVILFPGDIIEARVVNHDYFSLAASDGRFNTVLEQASHFVKLASPHKRLIYAVMLGNHELDKRVASVKDVSHYIVEGLRIESRCLYGHICAKFKVGKDKLYLHHGQYTANSKNESPRKREAQKCNAVKRFLLSAGDPDCFVSGTGHIHEGHVLPPDTETQLVGMGEAKQIQTSPTMYQDCDVIPHYMRWYFSTPSFFKTRSSEFVSYGEKGGYSVTQLGFTRITRDKGRMVNVESVLL